MVLAPALLAIAIAIKLDSRGPVIFAQERVGLNRRRFRALKFRTMVPDAERCRRRWKHSNEADGPVFKIKTRPAHHPRSAAGCAPPASTSCRS